MYRFLCSLLGLPDYEWKYHRLMGYLEARALATGVSLDRSSAHPTEVAAHDALQSVADYAKIMDIEDREALGGDHAEP